MLQLLPAAIRTRLAFAAPPIQAIEEDPRVCEDILVVYKRVESALRVRGSSPQARRGPCCPSEKSKGQAVRFPVNNQTRRGPFPSSLASPCLSDGNLLAHGLYKNAGPSVDAAVLVYWCACVFRKCLGREMDRGRWRRRGGGAALERFGFNNARFNRTWSSPSVVGSAAGCGRLRWRSCHRAAGLFHRCPCRFDTLMISSFGSRRHYLPSPSSFFCPCPCPCASMQPHCRKTS